MKKRRGKGQNQREAPLPDGAPPPPADAPKAPPARRLYTRCPGCQTAYRITLEQLRAGRGQAECQECRASFNVLETLAETAARARMAPAPASLVLLGQLEAAAPPEGGPPPLPAPDEPPGSAPPPRGRLAWGVGTALLLALLAVQLGRFKGPQLAQDERLRPWLESACQTLGCRLPAFRAPQRIQIVSHALRPAPDGADGYEFTLVIANQAALPQAFPAVKLVLSAENGSPAAARVFQPAEYLPGPALMPVGELREIRLLMAKPRREIGGFSFDLL